MSGRPAPAPGGAARDGAGGRGSDLARGDGLGPVAVGPFDAAALAAYARASGDDNPLHLDANLARAAGFAAPPVHGMLLAAAIAPVLRGWRPELRLVRLNAQFVDPLLAGESAGLTARILRVGEEGILARVVIQGPRRAPCLIAEATLAAGAGQGARSRAGERAKERD